VSDFTVSIFLDKAGATLDRRKMSLADLAELVQETAAPCKDRLPLLSLATFGDKRSKSTRCGTTPMSKRSPVSSPIMMASR
jgi:hypothetical protein